MTWTTWNGLLVECDDMPFRRATELEPEESGPEEGTVRIEDGPTEDEDWEALRFLLSETDSAKKHGITEAEFSAAQADGELPTELTKKILAHYEADIYDALVEAYRR